MKEKLKEIEKYAEDNSVTIIEKKSIVKDRKFRFLMILIGQLEIHEVRGAKCEKTQNKKEVRKVTSFYI